MLAALSLEARAAAQRGGPPGPPPAPRAAAPFDLTGQWIAVVNEDWRHRMTVPPKGDYTGVPLNPNGRRTADTWDPVRDEASGEQCRAYGVAALMRLPTRVRISWTDDQALKSRATPARRRGRSLSARLARRAATGRASRSPAGIGRLRSSGDSLPAAAAAAALSRS